MSGTNLKSNRHSEVKANRYFEYRIEVFPISHSKDRLPCPAPVQGSGRESTKLPADDAALHTIRLLADTKSLAYPSDMFAYRKTGSELIAIMIKRLFDQLCAGSGSQLVEQQSKRSLYRAF